MTKIVNLTPHPVTIIRSIPDPTGAPADRLDTRFEYPPCAPYQLPRATEANVVSCTHLRSEGRENAAALERSGVVDEIGYTGVENLPALPPAADRVSTFYIVSIVTVIGALAGGRGIEDLLVPMGQIRDVAGRIIGAAGLAPACALMTPLYEAQRARILDSPRTT